MSPGNLYHVCIRVYRVLIICGLRQFSSMDITPIVIDNNTITDDEVTILVDLAIEEMAKEGSTGRETILSERVNHNPGNTFNPIFNAEEHHPRGSGANNASHQVAARNLSPQRYGPYILTYRAHYMHFNVTYVFLPQEKDLCRR